jgi:hypothetical protein
VFLDDAGIWLAPLLGLVGAFIGAALAPWLTERFSSRRTRLAAFDRAIVAARKAQYVRWSPTDVSGIGTLSETTAATLNAEFQSEHVRRFITAQTELRACIAELEPYHSLECWRPEIDWELTEAVAASVIDELKRAKLSRTRQRALSHSPSGRPGVAYTR